MYLYLHICIYERRPKFVAWPNGRCFEVVDLGVALGIVQGHFGSRSYIYIYTYTYIQHWRGLCGGYILADVGDQLYRTRT